MHDAARRPLQDVLTAIRYRTPLDSVGRKLQANAERHLKSGAEMARLFAEAPQALAESLRFLEGLAFSLADLKNEYPEELRAGYATPQEALEAYATAGAATRYNGAVPAKVKHALAHELAACRRDELRALFSHRARHRALCARPKDLVPGARLGGQFDHLLLPRHHRCRSGTKRTSFRALHLEKPRRAAGHRCRFRARAARRGDAIYLQSLWPRPRRTYRHRHHLSQPLRPARCRQGLRPLRGCHRGSVELALGRRVTWPAGATGPPPRPRPARGPAGADAGAGARACRLSAAPFATYRRLRHYPRPARRNRAHRPCRDGRTHHGRMGQGRPRCARPFEGRYSRPRHAHLPAQEFRPFAQVITGSI